MLGELALYSISGSSVEATEVEVRRDGIEMVRRIVEVVNDGREKPLQVAQAKVLCIGVWRRLSRAT